MNVPALTGEDTNQAPQEAATSSPSRAWDLLRTMKAQRESLVERWKEGGAPQHRPPSDSLKDTRLCMKELRRNLDQEGQRRRVARRVSIDGSDRTPSTAASTDASSVPSVKPEEPHLHKSIHVPTSGDSPSIVRVTSQGSSSSEEESKVSSDSSLPTTRMVDDNLQVPKLQRISAVEAKPWRKDSRPPSRSKDPSTIPRRIVSMKESIINAPMSPLSVSPLSVGAEIDLPSKPIVEEVECSHLPPSVSLDDTSSEDVCAEVPKSPLNIQEDRCAYMGPLYTTKGPRTPPRRPPTGLRRNERRVVNDAMLHPEKAPATPEDTIVNMSFLDRVVAEMNGASPPPNTKVERPPSPLSSSTSLSGGDESSTTIGDVTSSSETSGWVSTGGESTLLGDGMSFKTDRSSLASRKRPSKKAVSRPKTVSFTPVPAKPRRPLFVTARTADALCRANGGHWSLARQSGWDSKTVHVATWKPKECTVPATTSIRLSTDFRCGTYGSLYDIALRSGSQELSLRGAPPSSVGDKKKQEIQRKQPTRGESAPRTKPSQGRTTQAFLQFLPARGGIYDTAVQSGFTAGDQRSAYSVTTHCTNKETMVPEHISDGHCGVVSVFSNAALHVIPE
jgi:hypothetical protein